jgi:3-mercaptopyruvate sulfurtransferase SseA
MIIVIFLICVGVLVLGTWLYNEVEETFGGVTMFCGISGSVISFVTFILLLVSVSNLKVIDAKIEMYQDENLKIENQITECVKQYQQYETEIFTEVAPESAITLVVLYPELKADTLVSKQIDVYLANNQKIKELKESKISGDVYRWWAYFGSSTEKVVIE